MTTNEIYNPFTTYPNQLFGKISKPKYKEQGMKFMYVGIEEIRQASIDLTPSAFKLYLYFVENEDGWEFNFSPKNFQNVYKVAESTYRKAKQELIDKKYIVEEQHNHFIFYSSPREFNITIDELRRRLNEAAATIEIYNKESYTKYKNEVKEFTNKEEKEKIRCGINLLKRMEQEAHKLKVENNNFGF